MDQEEADYFGGEYVVKMDAKGRVVVPAPVRSALLEVSGDQPLKLFKHDSENCLVLAPMPVWRRVMKQVMGYSRHNREARRLQRLIGAAMACLPDSNNRLLVPPPMRSHAQLDKEVVFLGCGSTYEIWDRGVYERWDTAVRESDSDDRKELPPLVY